MSGSPEAPDIVEHVSDRVTGEVELMMSRYALAVPDHDLPEVVAAFRLVRSLAERIEGVPEVNAISGSMRGRASAG